MKNTIDFSILKLPEVRSLFAEAGIISYAEANKLSKKALEELLDTLSTKDHNTLYKKYCELIPDGGEDMVLDMAELNNEIKSMVADAFESNTDIEKVRGLIKHAHLLVKKAEIVEEIDNALKNFRPQSAGPSEITIHPVVGESKKMKGLVHNVFPDVLQLASQRMNILLTGPSGAGKSHLGEQVAEALDARAFAAISCSAGMSEGDALGRLLPLGKNGQWLHQPAPFIDIAENGGVFMFDEFDAADENMTVLLNMFLSNGKLFIPQRVDKPELVRHPDCIILAGANTYGNGADAMYVGRNQLDAATMDRFRVGTVFMDYDRELEIKLCDKHVLDWGWNIRDKIVAHKLRRVMSTRTLINLSKMKKAYPQQWGTSDAWTKRYMADWSDDDRRLTQ